MTLDTEQNKNELVFQATAADAGKRLDAFLAENIDGWSRSRLQRLIDDGDVLVNQTTAKPSYKLRENDDIDVDLTEAPAARFEPENIPLEIVFEDEYLAVINKPAGLVVHPGAGVSSGTLANAIAYHFGVSGMQPVKAEPPALAGGTDASISNLDRIAQIDEQTSAPNDSSEHDRNPANTSRVGIVHRLDKQTSGLIVVAKSEEIHEAMSEQFRAREVYKSYVALVHGSPRDNTGIIDRPMARDRWHRTKMTVAANGRNALSLWKVRQRFDKFALVEVEIKTGRTSDPRPSCLDQSPGRRRRNLQRRPRQYGRQHRYKKRDPPNGPLFPSRRKTVLHASCYESAIRICPASAG
jgi:23S rRNA pseudouridine1911/1915/1917 synthase